MWNQPPSSARADSSGCCQYPANTWLDLASTSPVSSARDLHADRGHARPRLQLGPLGRVGMPSHSAGRRLMVSSGAVSVSP